MSLHSQSTFNVRHEDKGRDWATPQAKLATYDTAPDQDAYAAKMAEQSEADSVGEEFHHGRPSLWNTYRVLLLEHGELTTNDFAVKLKKDRETVASYLCLMRRKGRVESTTKYSHVIWTLVK